jgi:hypothetical protein
MMTSRLTSTYVTMKQQSGFMDNALVKLVRSECQRQSVKFLSLVVFAPAL